MRGGRGNTWKLGLFVTLGLLALTGGFVWLGVQQATRDTVPFVTLFEDSVSGLEDGAEVGWKGIQVGTVTGVEIAPDGRRVLVRVDLWADELRRLRVRADASPPPELRFELAMAGLTGGRELRLTFVDPAQQPPRDLGELQPPSGYVPSVEARYGTVQDAVTEVASQVGPAVERIERAVAALEQRILAVDAGALQTQVQATLTEFETAAQEIRAVAGQLSGPQGELTSTLEEVRGAARTLQTSVERLEAEQTTRTLRESATAVSATARRFTALGDQVEIDLIALQETLESLRRLSDMLERNPDALLRGREIGGPR